MTLPKLLILLAIGDLIDHTILLDYIDTLPANSTPKVLGLERDTEIHYLTTVTQELWAQMLHLSGEGGGDHVETSSVLQMVEDILESLPAQFDREAMKEDFKNKISPTSIVLLQVCAVRVIIENVEWSYITGFANDTLVIV